MRAAILLLAFFLAPLADAQQVYKCIKGREVSYQSAPCDHTQSLAKQWEATPEPTPSAAEIHADQAKHRRDVIESAQPGRVSGKGRAGYGRRTGKASSVSTADRRCNAAKARREAKLISVGLKRTFDLLRKLDDVVHEACK